MEKAMTRRCFLRKTLRAGICLGALPKWSASAWSKPLGANDDIRIAIVGLNGHGTGAHLNRYIKMKGVRVVALCDPDRAVLQREVKRFRGRKQKIDTYVDIRKLLENKSIDAISGATPNHWHALSSVWACQAGKHVCVEKPVSHNIWEGRKMVEAAERYGRLVQADLDLRSSKAIQRAIEYIQREELGKVVAVHSWVYKRRKSIGKVRGSGTVPDSVDYDLWCGPAPKVPLPRVRLHYDWHWQWDYGNGEIGNNGPHHLDVCRWALGKSELPAKVMTIGGRFGYDDDGQTPNTSITIFDYRPAPILFEVRGLPRSSSDNLMDPYTANTRRQMRVYSEHNSPSPNCGTIVVCEHGYVNLTMLTAHEANGRKIKGFTGGGDNCTANFIAALRSGKTQDLRTTILEGHLSTSLCHMGNISHRLGAEATVEEINDIIKKNDEAMDAFERMREHLAANGINLKKTPPILGPMLTLDPRHERFVGLFADKANKLVKRTYRKPFVIREEV